MRWDRLFRNPCDAADPPRLGGTEDEKTQAWTSQELRQFLEVVKHDRLYPLWLTLAMTGLRRGEALALRWSDVDLERARFRYAALLFPSTARSKCTSPRPAGVDV